MPDNESYQAFFVPDGYAEKRIKVLLSVTKSLPKKESLLQSALTDL